MKRLGFVPALLLAAGVLAHPAAAADMGPYDTAPRHHAVHPEHHRHHWHQAWGWGADVPGGPVAAVIVARGPVPLTWHSGDPYAHPCYAPHHRWRHARGC